MPDSRAGQEKHKMHLKQSAVSEGKDVCETQKSTGAMLEQYGQQTTQYWTQPKVWNKHQFTLPWINVWISKWGRRQIFLPEEFQTISTHVPYFGKWSRIPPTAASEWGLDWDPHFQITNSAKGKKATSQGRNPARWPASADACTHTSPASVGFSSPNPQPQCSWWIQMERQPVKSLTNCPGHEKQGKTGSCQQGRHDNQTQYAVL